VSSYVIRDVRLDDDVEMRVVYESLRSAELDGREDRPYWGEAEFAAVFRNPIPGTVWHLLAAFDGDRALGVSILELPQLDNLDKAYVHYGVAPAERGRGIGTAVDEAARQVARSAGRSTMIATTYVPFDRREDHPNRRWAEGRGYRVANIEIVRVLDLPVDPAQLDVWSAHAAERHADYQIETYVDVIPDPLLPSFLTMYGLLALEAPTGDIDFEAEVMTEEAFRERQRVSAELGRRVYFTLAVDPGGEVVAYTTIGVPAGDQPNAYQWGTLVHPQHRGHRLGLAVKAANLRTVQTAHPDRRRVWTTNSEVNAAMVGINETMGFRPVEVLLEMQRKDDAFEAAVPGPEGTTRGDE
jgi:GNAT superfamily N-acetyltransferase